MFRGRIFNKKEMNIIKSFETAFKKMEERSWDRIYVLVDIHDTIFHASYEKKETYKWFPCAMECLQKMTKRDDIALILWTSTHREVIDKYLDVFAKNGIVFDFVNINTTEKDNSLSCFREKTYFNVGLDDKFGFEPETDWKLILEYLVQQ